MKDNSDVSAYQEADYMAGVADVDSYNSWYRCLLEVADTWQEVTAQTRILDFGAGRCHLHAFLEGRGYQHVTSFEPNLQLHEDARQRVGPGARIVSSTRALKGQQFDVVFANHVVEHVSDPLAIVNDTLEPLLAPGGRVVFAAPNWRSLNRPILGRFWPGWCPKEHNWFFDQRSAPAALAGCSLRTRHSAAVSACGKEYDAFSPSGRAKRAYYRLIMPVFERVGRGDQVIIELVKD